VPKIYYNFDVTEVKKDLMGCLHNHAELMVMAGYSVIYYCGYRRLEEQARLYRQTRTINAINKKAEKFVNMGIPKLADILWSVGPQFSDRTTHLTYAGPGESWHNWGMAVDGVPVIGGKAVWDDKDPVWEIYRQAAEDSNLHVLNFEMPHLQIQPARAKVLDMFTPEEINDMIGEG
jgi:peptidoglycan L-alanyl-D-glutamate endopeptidase CwlK